MKQLITMREMGDHDGVKSAWVRICRTAGLRRLEVSWNGLTESANPARDVLMTQSETMTVLRDVLEVARLAQAKVTLADLAPPWGLQIDPSADLAIHLVRKGQCWLHAEPSQPLLLAEGDIAFIRDGVAHAVSDTPKSPILPYRQGLEVATERALTRSADAKEKVTQILCAKYSFQPTSWHPLLTALPSVAVVRAASVMENRQLHLLVEVLDAELKEVADGQSLLLSRLMDSLLILVLRTWIADPSEIPSGWVAALRNPEVAQALSYIHQQPQESWTAEKLAQRTGQSRATFNRKFVELVGEPPAAYLARWRMSLAADLLVNSSLSLEEVASRVGYESSAAFSKAFRRSRGVSVSVKVVAA